MGVRRDALKRGDHIYTDRCAHVYHHHGIYVGKGTVSNSRNEEKETDDAVIHFLGVGKSKSKEPCERCWHSAQKLGVVITCLDCFLKGHSLYIYKYDTNYLKLRVKRSGSCSVKPSRPADEVVATASDFLKQQNFGKKYHFFFTNCEDFATHCKTGKGTSNEFTGSVFGFGPTGLAVYKAAKKIYKVIVEKE